MDEHYDVSYDIVKQIHPTLSNLDQRSTVHCVPNDSRIEEDGYFLYRLPSQDNTYWVQFKYACFDLPEELECGVIAKTEEGITIELSPMKKQKAATWTNLPWVLPTHETTMQAVGFFIKIKAIYHPCMQYFKCKLLGFHDLLEKSAYYVLKDTPDESLDVIVTKVEFDSSIHARNRVYENDHGTYADGTVFIRPMHEYVVPEKQV